jgi:Predicted membrane protein
MIIGIIRTIILYILVMVAIRLLGKRQVGQLEPSELVLALLIADIAAVPMQEYGTPMAAGVVPIITLLCLAMIVSVLNVKSVRFRDLMCGTPSIIIRGGKLDEKEMGKNRYTLDELSEQLRQNGVTDFTQVQYAILETSGQLSVLLKVEEQPVTAKQMKVQEEDPGLPITIIEDGKIMGENLKRRGLDRNWLEKVLAQNKVSHAQEIFLLTVNELNETYCAVKEREA